MEKHQNIIFKRIGTLPSQPIDDTLFLVDPGRKMLHSMNDMAAFIWDKLAEGASIDGLAEMIIQEYDADMKTVRDDLSVFLKALQEKGLVEAVK